MKTCLKADLYRRCGDFGLVKTICTEYKAKEEINQTARNYQYHLAEENDAACHTVTEAKEYAEMRAGKSKSL